MARSWAKELAHRKITVNVISPAATNTPMHINPSRAESKPILPLFGRLIELSEIAQLVLYLISSYADMITGQELTVCGGSSL